LLSCARMRGYLENSFSLLGFCIAKFLSLESL
jgi:hypothetical protein